MKDPAFLFYSSDFLSGTMLMSDEEIGQYIKLLCLQHQKGHLKEKDMLNICKTYNEDIFSKFKKDEEGNYYNERLENEVNRRKAYSESRRNNRNKGDNSNTCVYLIKNLDNGLIKIGSSNNPERRIIELKNQLGTQNLKILAFVENVEQKIETELHKIYSTKNKINEWFELDETDISNIICNYHMKNHMIEHMETETETETITININNKNEENLQKKFIECLNSFNENAISECLDYLKKLPYEVIEYVLSKTSRIKNPNWAYAKTILDDYTNRKIDTLEKIQIEETEFKTKSEQKSENKKSRYKNYEQRDSREIEFHYANEESG